MIDWTLRSSGPLGNELASFWLSETKLMESEWLSTVSTNAFLPVYPLRPERLPSQGHTVDKKNVDQRHGSHPLIGEPWSFSPLRRSRLGIHTNSRFIGRMVGFLYVFIQSFSVEVWTLHVFVPSGRPSLEATLTPMVPPARETSQMESSMAGTVGGWTAALGNTHVILEIFVGSQISGSL